jgi:hypothetical protein
MVFNRWSRRIGETQAKKAGGPIVEVRVSEPRPVRSRIQALQISQAASPDHKQLGGRSFSCELAQSLGTV